MPDAEADPLRALLDGEPRRVALEELRETLGRERADALLRDGFRQAVMDLHDARVVGREQAERAAVHDALGIDSDGE